jgi:hypothetical protein
MKMRSCVVVAVVLGWTAYAGAGTVVYDANADMLGSETSATPSAAFGQWTLGHKEVAAEVSGCTALSEHFVNVNPAFGGFTTYFGAERYNQVYLAMNTGSVALGTGGEWAPGIISGGTSNPSTFTVLRWRAPGAGTVDIAATVGKYLTGDQDVHVVLGSATAGTTGTSLFLDYLNDPSSGSKTSVSYAGSSITVTSGSVIDLLLGIGPSNNFGNDCFVIPNCQISFTAVPEPSSIAIFGSALLGLLAYAWRKRK